MYTIQLDDADMRILSAALSELPYKVVTQLIAKINAQLAKQASSGKASNE